tara:strand:- start:510 stop:839 length:330 start_codon:yes stop_codon:yes gene_type:complete
MQLTGTIKSIGETQSFGEKGFRKRELVLTTDDQYPQDILIEFVQDKCDVLNKYSVNQSVEVGFNVRGREWTNPKGEVKYFNSIQGWRIKEMGAEAEVVTAEADNGDLPF